MWESGLLSRKWHQDMDVAAVFIGKSRWRHVRINSSNNDVILNVEHQMRSFFDRKGIHSL